MPLAWSKRNLGKILKDNNGLKFLQNNRCKKEKNLSRRPWQLYSKD